MENNIVLFFVSVFTLITTTHATTVNQEWMKHSLETIFSHSRHHKTGPQEKLAARNFIKARFKDDGLTVYSQVFDTELSEVKGENIIGLLPGTKFNTSSDIIYAIGAHYDTMPNTPEIEYKHLDDVLEHTDLKNIRKTECTREGQDYTDFQQLGSVDDNGSGVVAMLETARILAETKDRQYSILFIAFDFEEWEYPGKDTACSKISCGSRKFVEEWVSTAERNNQGTFGGIIVMDTVLNYNNTDKSQIVPAVFQYAFPDNYKEIEKDDFEGDFYFVISRPFDANLSKAFINSWKGAGNPDFQFVHLNLTQIHNPPTKSDVAMFGDLFRSDHGSFWNKKLPAIFISDTANFRGYMKQCYHEACDTIEHVDTDDMKFLGKLTASLVSSMQSLTVKLNPHVINSASCFQSGISFVVGILLLWTMDIIR